MNADTSSFTGADLRRIRATARRRPRLVTAALLLTLVAAFAARVLLGSYTVTLPDFLTILGGGRIPNAPGASFIVLEDKLPKAVLGLLAGLAFGCAGALFQLLLRNPLASPDVIGISASASLGAVVAAAGFGASGLGLATGALVGGLAAALVVFALSSGAGDQRVGNRFILSGLGLGVLASALTHFAMSRMNLYKAADAAIWMTGSLGAANWGRVRIVAVALAVLLPAVMLLHRDLHAVAVGDDLARGLGVGVNRTRWMGLALGVLLVVVAVAMTGPIAFVAFVSGPVARKLVGGTHHLTASALVGAIIVLVADLVAGNYVPGGPLPAGVLTGMVGAPVLLWLVATGRQEGS